MTEEKLEFANMLQRKIDKLDREIYDLMGIMPAIRSTFPECNRSRRGYFKSIVDRKLKVKEGLRIEVELSNEDIRALVDIRTSEQEALKQVLRELE